LICRGAKDYLYSSNLEKINQHEFTGVRFTVLNGLTLGSQASWAALVA
jgi:hypothetical protein